MEKEYKRVNSIKAEKFDASFEMMKKYKIREVLADKQSRDKKWHFISTKEGNMFLKKGYYISTGSKGEHWAIAPENFEQDYSLVSDLSESDLKSFDNIQHDIDINTDDNNVSKGKNVNKPLRIIAKNGDILFKFTQSREQDNREQNSNINPDDSNHIIKDDNNDKPHYIIKDGEMFFQKIQSREEVLKAATNAIAKAKALNERNKGDETL